MTHLTIYDGVHAGRAETMTRGIEKADGISDGLLAVFIGDIEERNEISNALHALKGRRSIGSRCENNSARHVYAACDYLP